MKFNNEKLVLGDDFYFLGLSGQEYRDIEIVAPEGAIIRRSENGVKVWRNRKEWLRWHVSLALPFLGVAGLVLFVVKGCAGE
jgi:hypothetical protein